MFEFTHKVPVNPKKKTKGTNACKYIILHHTASRNFKWDLNVLSGNTAVAASCHFLIGPKGERAKIGEPEDILWHTGESARWAEKRMGGSLNRCSLGIEITGPMEDQGFTSDQKKRVKSLVEHLMAAYSIPHENVLRHCDLTHSGSKRKILRVPGTIWRKRDVSTTFFDGKAFETRRKDLTPQLA